MVEALVSCLRFSCHWQNFHSGFCSERFLYGQLGQTDRKLSHDVSPIFTSMCQDEALEVFSEPTRTFSETDGGTGTAGGSVQEPKPEPQSWTVSIGNLHPEETSEPKAEPLELFNLRTLHAQSKSQSRNDLTS